MGTFLRVGVVDKKLSGLKKVSRMRTCHEDKFSIIADEEGDMLKRWGRIIKDRK